MISNNIFVTGATGLIGKSFCKQLAKEGMHLIALVRNIENARTILPGSVTLVKGDITNQWDYDGQIDYIVHMAGITDSQSFIDKPVEVINSTISGAQNAIRFSIKKNVKKLVFLSTMETYGLTNSANVSESDFVGIDPTTPRNCYPESKRLAECLFASAHKEYGVPAVIARLTQTFGTGVSPDDKRVFSQFASAIRDGRDIVLKTSGETARCYCSTNDAVNAIKILLDKGNPGVAYNVANPETFCTIREMAELVVDRFSNGKSKVIMSNNNLAPSAYLPTFKMNLNINRIMALGWKPQDDLVSMFKEII